MAATPLQPNATGLGNGNDDVVLDVEKTRQASLRQIRQNYCDHVKRLSSLLDEQHALTGNLVEIHRLAVDGTVEDAFFLQRARGAWKLILNGAFDYLDDMLEAAEKADTHLAKAGLQSRHSDRYLKPMLRAVRADSTEASKIVGTCEGLVGKFGNEILK